MRLKWLAEYTDVDTWRTLELTIENLATQFSSSAGANNPNALEEVTIAGAGTEAYFGMQQLQGVSGTGVTDSIQFIFTPKSGHLPGDFDVDGDVDGTDLLVWQSSQFSTQDLLPWQSNYGTVLNLETSSTTAVPESTTFVGMVLCLNFWSLSRKISIQTSISMAH